MALQELLDDLRKRPGSGDVISVIDPATEETITEFTDCGADGVDEAVAAAKASFESGVWSQLPGCERAKVIWRIADLIADKRALFGGLFDGTTDEVKFDGSGSFLTRVEKLLDRLASGTITVSIAASAAG